MKKKVVISLISFTIIVCLLSLGFNIYFLATMHKSPSGIFDMCKERRIQKRIWQSI